MLRSDKVSQNERTRTGHANSSSKRDSALSSNQCTGQKIDEKVSKQSTLDGISVGQYITTIDRYFILDVLIHFQFVRLALNTPSETVETVENILTVDWNLKRPRIILSILGGAKYFNMDDGLKMKFTDEIIEIASKPSKNSFPQYMANTLNSF